jgi:phosphatidylglycerophosphate synthase
MILLATGGLILSAVGGIALAGGQLAGMAASAPLFALVAVTVVRAVAQAYPHDRLGACNAVTLLRAAMTGAVAGPLVVPGLLAAEPALAWAVFGVAALALALDGVDGWLARRSGLASAFGARFDMEVDSLLALVLACLAVANGKAGLWILALGGMRYAFVAAGWFLPWLNGALPERRRRKAVCVVQIAVLVALVAPAIVPPAATALALAATMLLVWSFVVDVLWLERRR